MIKTEKRSVPELPKEIMKMHSVKPESQAIGEFLEWLHHEKQWELAEWENNSLYPAHYSIEKLLAEFFEIDLDKVDKEKRALLDQVRRLP